MTDAAPAASACEFKSTTLDLLALLPKTADIAHLDRDLAARSADAPGLFDGEGVSLDLGALRAAAGDAEADALDLGELLALLRRHGLRPLAIRGGSPAQTEAALAAGLVEDLAIAPRAPVPRPAAAPAAAAPSEVAPAPVTAPEDVPPAAAADADPDPATATPVAPRTLVVDRPLRSGQQVYARGGDLVLLAAVNAGAEVIADGHILAYAPLRGRVVAGARGDTTARIVATCMEPQLVAIAGTYRTIESPLAADVQGKAAQVRLDADGRLVFEPLRP